MWRFNRRTSVLRVRRDGLTDERQYLECDVFSKNAYKPDFATRNTNHTETNSTNTNPTTVTTATVPYIKGSPETIARILQPYNIRVPLKSPSLFYDSQHITNVNDKDEPKDRQVAVYKIKCCDCQATYIDDTGRNFNARHT